ncbi:MAG: sugar phosphate nucleotidyltransferase [Deltaproteobacteria bacterium]|nr:sugar phosphate nucleotidyltransferase [Deltaproteobacteria bacterium]
MKTVILAGGMGTRLTELTDNRPKNMDGKVAQPTINDCQFS